MNLDSASQCDFRSKACLVVLSKLTLKIFPEPDEEDVSSSATQLLLSDVKREQVHLVDQCLDLERRVIAFDTPGTTRIRLKLILSVVTTSMS